MAAFNAESAQIVALTTGATTEDRAAAAAEICAAVKKTGFASLESSGVTAQLKAALEGTPVAKEGGVLLFNALSEAPAVPLLLPLLPAVIELTGDKKAKDAKKVAPEAVAKFAKVVAPFAAVRLVKTLLTLSIETRSWQAKEACLNVLSVLAESAPEQVSASMVSIVPVVSELMWETKKQVKTAATNCMKACCDSIDNGDIEPFIPALISAINHPEEVPECVHALASTTFVQAVDASALSITVPVLDRGYKERATNIKRRCAVITENMAKLVKDPADVEPFMPVLGPHLERAKEEVADPECRARCNAAHEALIMIGKLETEKVKVELSDEQAKKLLLSGITKAGGKDLLNATVETYFINILKDMALSGNFDVDDVNEEFSEVFKLVVAEDKVADAITVVREGITAVTAVEHVEIEEDDGDDSEQLCDCKFSLAYGAKILLNNARLRLKRGKRYGIVAAKSAGKTTLLRSIANGQVEGFPVDTCKTVFVEHDIQGSQTKMNVLEFAVDTLKGEGVPDEEVEKALKENGFNDTMRRGPITSLSGGWKMKLGLVRAVLRKADILLLDEPTNHLDVINVQWVVDYLTGPACANVTSLIVSHDTKFLDNVATNIIHFHSLKLDNLVGNLSAFVERYPEAKAYYDLSKSTLKFSFPEPGPLDGVKSKGRAILSMTNVEFTYPTAAKPQISGVTIKVSMASRVACVGANGAGKSTMIKLLTGEMKPNKGVVYKHPNCRFAYVAQHAFHHIEQHLDKTPNEYIQWRYQGGEDKEALVKSTAQITPEEKAKMEKPIEFKFEDDKGKKIVQKRVVEKVVSRRKAGKILEYEVKWKNLSQDLNSWYPRDTLIDMGFDKLLKEMDRRKAAQEGMYARTLSQRNVEKHLLAVGLDAELGTHNRIRDLSGGQKVKVVLAACTWAQPHLIILDEPTNYLDRESLGALAGAINDFEGGVVLITHNKEFADATTRETWVVAANKCDVKGDAEWEKYAQEAIDLGLVEDQTDASGNIVEKKNTRTPESLKPREKKKMMKELKNKIKNDLEMTDFEEECARAWDMFS